MIICICGKSGSGKSTFARNFQKLYGNKAIHVDIDKIAHFILNDNIIKKDLITCFGDNILSDGLIDRSKLGDIVFNSKIEMNKLSNITWNCMEKKIDNIIVNNKNKIILLDYALLPITKYFNMADIKIYLDVDYLIRKKRCIKRDNINEEKFDLREKNSLDYSNYIFDYVINNGEDVKGLVKIYE